VIRLTIALAIGLAALAATAGENLALGKKYTLSKPNYHHCTDPGDRTQLTDGITSKGYFWTQKTTVGWRGGAPKLITIDLGQVYPIGGISFSSAAGAAQVGWAEALLVFVSDDGKSWFEAGDLVELSARQAKPPVGKYATHVFRTDELATHGRYVQIAAIPGGPYLFVDEIEVFRGDDTLLGKPRTGRPAPSVKALMEARQFNRLLKAQLRRDLAAATEDIPASLKQRAAELAAQIEKMPDVPSEGFRAVLPMTELEREIFRLQAAAWRAQGKPLLRVWKSHRWDPLAPSQEPPKDAPAPALDVRMMSNETRADVLNLTNAHSTDLRVRLRIEGLPGGANPDYLSVHEVLCVGTRHFVAVSAALPPAKRDGDHYVVTVPSGMTRQVWLRFGPKAPKPGTHDGKVVLDDGSAKPRSVPVRLQVFPLRFPDETTLHLSGWSYTNAERVYGVTPENRDALIASLKAHHVNAPWATRGATPFGTYDADGNMTGKPDTANFDAWVARWRGAKRYMVFLGLGSYSTVHAAIAGSQPGEPLFDKKVGAWARFWAQHMRDLGLKASQLGFLLLDEPNRKEQYDAITAWARAIRKAEPDVLLWEDAMPKDQETCLEMMASVDYLVANRAQWLHRSPWLKDLFADLRRQGRELGLYSCSGPARTFDPYSYYVLQQWHVFEIGGRGRAIGASATRARSRAGTSIPRRPEAPTARSTSTTPPSPTPSTWKPSARGCRTTSTW